MCVRVAQDGSPFIVCMTYAFQTPEKLCFILDLMNGSDLHYHLSQHGVLSEKEVRFYAAEVILGLEHMHRRYVVYRDLKVSTLFRPPPPPFLLTLLLLNYAYSSHSPPTSFSTNGAISRSPIWGSHVTSPRRIHTPPCITSHSCPLAPSLSPVLISLIDLIVLLFSSRVTGILEAAKWESCHPVCTNALLKSTRFL